MSNHLAHIIFLHHSPSITHFLIVLGFFIYKLQLFILLTWVTMYFFDFLLKCFCLQQDIHPTADCPNGQDCKSCIFYVFFTYIPFSLLPSALLFFNWRYSYVQYSRGMKNVQMLFIYIHLPANELIRDICFYNSTNTL